MSLKAKFQFIKGVFYLLRYGVPYLFTNDIEKQNAIIRHFFPMLIRKWKVTIDVKGTEFVEVSKSYIIVSNHSSLMDIPTLYASVPIPMRMAAKSELFKVPIFGRLLRHGHFIPIVRDNSTAAIHALKEATFLFDHQTSIFMAPEGTRSKTGELLPFKKGPFVFAIENQKDILPVVIIGAQSVVPNGKLEIHGNKTIKVRILQPISVQGKTYEERETLSLETRKCMLDVLTKESL